MSSGWPRLRNFARSSALTQKCHTHSHTHIASHHDTRVHTLTQTKTPTFDVMCRCVRVCVCFCVQARLTGAKPHAVTRHPPCMVPLPSPHMLAPQCTYVRQHARAHTHIQTHSHTHMYTRVQYGEPLLKTLRKRQLRVMQSKSSLMSSRHSMCVASLTLQGRWEDRRPRRKLVPHSGILAQALTTHGSWVQKWKRMRGTE